MDWNTLTTPQLYRLAAVALTAPNSSYFLKRATEILYKIRIVVQHNKQKARYLVKSNIIGFPAKAYDVLELHDILHSLDWLLDSQRLQVQSQRTYPIYSVIRTPHCGKLFAPSPELTNITLGQYLLAEDLRATNAPLEQFLAVLYKPQKQKEEPDYELLAKEIKSVLKNDSPELLAHLWWWEGNLRYLKECFPNLFSTPDPEQDTKPLRKELPSTFIYRLAANAPEKIGQYQNLNLYEALRLFSETLKTEHT